MATPIDGPHWLNTQANPSIIFHPFPQVHRHTPSIWMTSIEFDDAIALFLSVIAAIDSVPSLLIPRILLEAYYRKERTKTICGPIALQLQEQLLAIAMEEEDPEDPPKLKGVFKGKRTKSRSLSWYSSTSNKKSSNPSTMTAPTPQPTLPVHQEIANAATSKRSCRKQSQKQLESALKMNHAELLSQQHLINSQDKKMELLVRCNQELTNTVHKSRAASRDAKRVASMAEATAKNTATKLVETKEALEEKASVMESLEAGFEEALEKRMLSHVMAAVQTVKEKEEVRLFVLLRNGSKLFPSLFKFIEIRRSNMSKFVESFGTLPKPRSIQGAHPPL
ncbi:hypothetical protein HJC23_002596 [Cyclotella cryptica]|uniref:Uncharacterized protein n=1 Tax=Cyclotella cryptica TaxID=29204 RepID=A0ABD3PX89_9STRA